MSEIDLLPFCCREVTREYLAAPFSVGEFTYATNGHIAMRVARRDGVGEVDMAPEAIAGIFEANIRGRETAKPIPIIPQPAMKTCERCRGRGSVGKCEYCEGAGYQTCDLGHDHDCEECRGNGTHPAYADGVGVRLCGECEGLCRVPSESPGWGAPVIFSDTGAVGLRYANMIAKLPGVVWRTDIAPEDPVPFWFDGGVGLVMQTRFSAHVAGQIRIYADEPVEVVA